MLFGILVLLFGSTVLAAPLDRPADPLVLPGSAVPTLAGAAPADVVAFRWTTGWEQVPVQVDERALVDLNQPFGGYVCAGSPYCFPLGSPGSWALQYTDANTFTGADPDATLDGDDEIVFMVKDAGDQAPASSEPPDVVPGLRIEVHITDPLDGGEGWVYLFRQTGGLDPGAGQTYVDYDFDLLSGTYVDTYQRNGGPNPEDSTITSAFYGRHFSDRWLDDGLAITAGGASGVDILDRHKALVVGFGCFRTEDTLDAGEGCFVANKSGPVRAIRSYMGANSGPHTQRQHLFYERREDLRTFVRVHSLPGVHFFLDYSSDAVGMVYRNDLNPAGVTIDGVPDPASVGPITWETVDGAQGGLTMLTLVDTDIPTFSYGSTYLDDATVGGCTGDASTYGASGIATGDLPDTGVAPANTLSLARITYFEAPGEADGPGRRLQLESPPVVTVVETEPPSSDPCASTPVDGCRQPIEPGKARLQLRDKVPDRGDAVTWKWTKGAATMLEDWGDPLSTTDYALCLYDASSTLLATMRLPAGGTCGTKSCWRATGTTGFKYSDKERTPDGVARLALKASADGKAAIALVAKGDAVPMPSLAALILPLRAQLQGNDQCWEASYSSAIKDTGVLFKARSD